MRYDLRKSVKDLFRKSLHQIVLEIHWSLDEDKIMFRTWKGKHGHKDSFSLLCQILRSFGNHISFSHPSQDSIARTDKYKHEWDKVVIADNAKAIKCWVQETEILGTVGVNSLVVGTALGHTMEFQFFCNASLEAKAAVAYIKITMNHENTTRFLMGKRGVAPLRQTTIPRQELQAALFFIKIGEKNRGGKVFQF